MANFTLKVNGTTHQVEVEDDTPLLWVLRDHLNLVGTKFSCGIAQCGACTVHLNGNAIFSCVTPVSSIGNSEVTTIEGLSQDGDHPVQKAWEEVDVAQCGYCQAGQIMTAAAFLEQNPLLIEAINSSSLLSDGQQQILKILVQFDVGIPISQIMALTNLSKQTIHFNIKKLMERQYVMREKEMVYIYKANRDKIFEIIERYNQTKKVSH